LFGQTFEFRDLIVIGVLVVLEGVLSIDNALVLGLLARRLPRFLQRRALTYGLAGAIGFRSAAVIAASWLLHWHWVKLVGGAYLLWVAVKHFLLESDENPDEKLAVGPDGRPILVEESTGRPLTEEQVDEEIYDQTHGRGAGWIDYAQARNAHSLSFWMAVGAIELTDIAFAVDSIVAAIGVVGPPPPGRRHPKLWVVIVGGMLGVALMRFAAVLFIRLLERFPRFETSAYLLVTVIGAKLIVDYLLNTPAHPDRWDVHDPSELAFWLFWGLMLVCFLIGFLPSRQRKGEPAPVESNL
jgi:YkoY family integral membrane protein